MGVSLEIYRMRIGLFSHRGPRPCREKERMVQMKPAKRGHPWRLYLVTLYITLCYVALIIRLVPVRNGEYFIQNNGVEVPTISTTKPVSLFTWEHGMSRVVWQTGLPDTQASDGDIWRQVTAIGVNQLRFAGDVEENPGPPKIDLKSVVDLQIESVTDTQIRIRWKDPYNVGFLESGDAFKSKVKGALSRSKNPDTYWFEATIKANVAKTLRSDPKCLQASFENLRACTEYEISVVVVAEEGSRQSKPEVRKITTDIGAPRNVEAEADGPDKIRVTWKHPEPPPTHFLLRVYCEKNKVFDMPLERTRKEYTVTDLKEGTEYSISLGAKKGTNKNFCTPVICRTALLHGVDFRVGAKTEHSITVHWTTDQNVPSTPPLQHVTFIRTGDTVRWYKKHGAEDNERTFDNLDVGTKYTVGIRKGSGDDWSDAKEETVTTDLPPPSNIVVAEPQCNSARLTWEVDYNADMFVVEWWEKGNEGQRQNYTRTSPDAVLGPLQPGTTYVVELSAKKHDVQSGSLLHEIVTKPMHPEKLTLESGVNEIKASWKKPKQGEVDDYEVTLVDVISGTVVQTFTENGTTTTIPGPSPGTKYKVRITANYDRLSSDPTEECIVTKPQPTAGLSTDEVTSDSVKVSWQPPEDPTGVIGYRLYCSTAGTIFQWPWGEKEKGKSLDVWTKERKETPYSRVLDTLMSNTKYDITVWSMAGPRDNPVLSSPTSLPVTTDIQTVTGLLVTPCDTTSILISWTAVTGWWPFSDDPEIRVHISASDGPGETVTLPGGTSTKRFENLRPVTLYTIHVALVGLNGKEGKPTTVTYPTRPRPITSISISEQTTTAIKVKWSAADDNDVTYMAQITGKDPILVGKDLAYCFDELEPGTSYDISITVKHNFEDGREVQSRPCKTKASTCPARPEAVSVKSCSPSSMILSWQPPLSGNIDCYKVEIWCTDQTNTRSGEQKPEQSHSIGKHRIEYTFDSLSTSPGSLHKITISAYFQNLSSEIVEKMQRTKIRSPGLKLSEKTQTSVTVSWEHVMGEKEKYRLSISPNEGEPDIVIPCSENRLQHTFRNLIPGKEYKASAITIYEDAECEPCVLTIRTVVPPPQNLTVIQQSITTDSFKIRWDHAVGEISGYIVYYKSQSGREIRQYEISASSREYRFENLTPGRLYKISVWTFAGNLGSTSAPTSVQERTLVASAETITVEDCTHSSVSFSWDKADGDVDFYEYCVMYGNVCVNVNKMTQSSDQRSVQVDDLTGGRMYELVVVAVSGDRRSQPTKTNHRTKVHKPEGLQVADVKMQQFTITWKQAQGDKDKYTAAVFDTTRQDRTPKDEVDVCASASALEHRFSAFVPGREYEIMLWTISGGDASDPEKRLVRTKPLRPVNVKTSVMDMGIMVEWSEPSGDKDEYILEISPKEDLHTPVVISTGDETSYTFPGVTLGKLYDVKIFSRSKDVDSGKVIRQQRMTVGQPNSVQLEPSEISVNVTWDHAEGEKERYHITIWDVGRQKCVRREQRNVDEDLEVKFYDLVSGRPYRVEVTTESGGELSECVSETVRTKLCPPSEINIADNDVKENSIRITWRKPDCDIDMDCYHVSISPTDDVENAIGVVEREQPLEYTFHNLTSGRKYQLSVITGSGGYKSDSVTKTKRTTVSRIEQINVRERTESTLTITWLDVKGEKSSYIASIREMTTETPFQNGFLDISAHSLDSSLNSQFINLTPGRMYEVSVVTVSGEMESLARTMLVRTIVPPPRNVRIPLDNVTEHSMDVVWENAEGDYTSYEHLISPKEGERRYMGEESLDGTVVRRSRFENLVPGKIYTIELWTRQKEADSEVKVLSQRTNVAAVEEKSIVFTNISEDEITLGWKEAEGEKDGYIVTIHPITDDTAAVILPPAVKADDDLQHTFRDLTPGRKHAISIVTFNENDKSSEVTKTIHTKPNKPRGFDVKTFAESIAVSWNSPTGIQDGYVLKITTVPEDPEWFINATFDEKTEPSNDEDASVLDEFNETRHFKYTFREKGMVKARTKYKISARTQSGQKHHGGQCSDAIAFEERTKPHPPRDPRLVKEGIESVTFSWAPPIDEEQKRDIHRYIVKYKGPEEEDEREHDCQFNTSAKIEHLRDHTEYDFFIISVVESRAVDGKIERVDSERCRFTFKTMSQSTKIVRKFSKKLKKVLFIVICGGAFAISLFTFLGVFVHNCVRPFGQSAAATVIPSTNSSNTPNNNYSVRPTASAQSFNSGLAECFVEKAGEQFWYFVFFTAVPATCLLAIILWKVIKRIRQNIMPRATPDAERGLLEDFDIEMIDMHSGEDKPTKLEYGRKATRQRWLSNTS